MQEALEEAKIAEGEVPVGAVLTYKIKLLLKVIILHFFKRS